MRAILPLIALLALLGCGEQKEKENVDITGRWVSINDQSIGVEFTENGEYHIWAHGEKIMDESSFDENPIRYKYNPDDSEHNLVIYDDDENMYMKCNLIIIDENSIKIELFNLDRKISENDFYRLNPLKKHPILPDNFTYK